MSAWVMFFIVWGKFGHSSINVDFTTQQQCESARQQIAPLIPGIKDGYFNYSVCLEK